MIVKIKKDKSFTRKILNEYGNFFVAQNDILQVASEFLQRFQKDPEITTRDVVSLSRDIWEEVNELLKKDTTMNIHQTIDQINLLKALGPACILCNLLREILAHN